VSARNQGYHLSYPHCWRDGDKKVDVVNIVINGLKLDGWAVLNYLRQLQIKIGKNSLIEDLLPKLGHDD
jgi:hypothetical protein